MANSAHSAPVRQSSLHRWLLAAAAVLAIPLQAGAAVVLSQDFDSVTAPALPAGWTSTSASGSNAFVTSSNNPAGGANGVFISDPASVSDTRLDAPTVSLAGFTNAFLSFQNFYNLEDAFDGGVLEASLNGGAFADILSFGAIFTVGGYTDTMSTGFLNPIPGRQAWSGNSGGYITTTVDLPDAFNGQNVGFRWRMTSDSSVGGSGWRIDSISLTADAAAGNEVPEPGALGLAGLALLVLAAARRRPPR